MPTANRHGSAAPADGLKLSPAPCDQARPAGRRFEGKVALVTGGASGIGLATVERLAQEGARVLLADWSERRGLTSEEALRARGLDVRFQLQDAGDAHGWEAVAHRLNEEKYGRLDVVVNNAYSGRLANLRTLTHDALNDALRVNVNGALMGMRLADDLMRDGGAVVNLSSIAALAPSADNMAYATAKAAVIQLTRSAALVLARRRPPIRVNAVAPGTIDTPTLRSTLRAIRGIARDTDVTSAVDSLGDSIPWGRVGAPAEVASTICFLASGEASFVTGQCLVVDGGQTLATGLT